VACCTDYFVLKRGWKQAYLHKDQAGYGGRKVLGQFDKLWVGGEGSLLLLVVDCWEGSWILSMGLWVVDSSTKAVSEQER
jgi:hypothetical protein